MSARAGILIRGYYNSNNISITLCLDVRIRYRNLARIYHPDQHDSTRTGMSANEAKAYFQLINNAKEYLREIL